MNKIADRREFLQRAVAAASLSAILSVFQNHAAASKKSLSVQEREALVDGIIGGMQRNLRSPEIQEAILGKAPYIIRPVLSSLNLIDVSNVLGTRYDVSEQLVRYAVQFGYGQGRDGKRRVGFVPASDGRERYLPPDVGYGNGFYWGRKDCFLTALHVFDAAQGRPPNSEAVDIMVMRVPPSLYAKEEQIIVDDPALNDANIDCAYVAVVGIDPDGTSMKSGLKGCKIYPGVAVKLTTAWVDRAFANADQYFRERLYRSFMMILPSGEAKGESKLKPALGMSGSPVFVLRNGSKVAAGLLHSVYEVPPSITGSTLDLGFFYGPDAIRQKIVEDARRPT